MKRTTTGMMLIAALLAFPALAAADRPLDPEFNFEFTYAAATGGSTQIGDFTVNWYPLTLTMPPPNPAWTIDYLEYDVVFGKCRLVDIMKWSTKRHH